MKKLIIVVVCLLVLALSASAEIAYYYKIELTYDHGAISYTTLQVVPSEKELKTPGANYIAELIGSDGKAIKVTIFGISTELLYDIVDPANAEIIGGGLRQLNKSEATLYLPYDESAQRINIYNLNLTKKLTIPVAELSKEAAVPEALEDVREFLPDAEREEARAVTPVRQVVNGVLIGIGVIAVLTVLAIILRRRKKKA